MSQLTLASLRQCTTTLNCRDPKAIATGRGDPTVRGQRVFTGARSVVTLAWGDFGEAEDQQ